MILGYDDKILKKIEIMPDAETNNFSHQPLDRYFWVMRT